MAFRVTGIYESGMAEYDDVYAYTALRDAQILFQLPDAVSGYDIHLLRVDSASVVADRVSDLLGYPHYARTVFDSYRNLFSWIELQKKPIPIILGLIIIVATVNIIGTLLMMVLDKMREVGVLATLGATRWGITLVFLRQGFTIAVAGTLLGNLLAFSLLYIQKEFRILSLPSDIYFMTSVPVLMRWEYFVVVSAITVALCMLSAPSQRGCLAPSIQSRRPLACSVERFIAGRYVRSKRQMRFINIIMLVSVIGITVGVAALIIVLSVFNGFNTVVTQVLVGFDPHIRIEAASGGRIGNVDSILRVVRSHREVAAASPFISGKRSSSLSA
jgi:ABC-type lipoprotein release transport system permease subunit